MLKSNNRYLIILGSLAFLSIAFSVYARLNLLFPLDTHLTSLLQSCINDSLTAVMQWISFLFESWRAALLVGFVWALVWWRLGWLPGLTIPLLGLISQINFLLKAAIDRPRPSAELVRILIIETDPGFPSGHAFFSIVFLGMAAYLLYARLKRKGLRILSISLLILLILLIGASRIYLGIHWVSDVLGGYLIGGFFLTLVIWFYEWWKFRSDIRSTSCEPNPS